MAADSEPERVLSFWFGTLDDLGRADDEHSRRWWKKDPVFDQLIRQDFGVLHAEVSRGEHADWLESARGTLASIIVLDQFSRNIFRGTARAFSSDARALEWAAQGIDKQFDQSLRYDERLFLYMPFQHSEDLAMQERSVQLFRSFRDSLEPGTLRDRASEAVDFAERHHDIVRRFGRFPHRNAMLDRTLTAEEIEFLKQPGSSF
jgi:uncharacterized protein (DUF924 family)